MAQDYYLIIQYSSDLGDAHEVLLRLADANALDIHPKSGLAIGSGVTANVFIDSDEESIFGATEPDLCVSFRVDKFENCEEGLKKMLQVFDWISQTTVADMQMNFNEEVIILEKKNNSLILNQSSEFWTRERLDLVHDVYSFASYDPL